MHAAAYQGQASVINVLVTHGLDPSERHKDGYTPLHRACWGGTAGHAEAVGVLIAAGVSANEPAANGKLPMEMAATETIKHALRAGGGRHKDEL